MSGFLWLSVGLGALAVLGGVVAYQNSEHFARRIDGFLSPDLDPTTQLGYATNAIREGGFFGVGVGEGQVKWSLPDAHTDFIIAVAAEEYGLILVLVCLGLFLEIRLAFWVMMGMAVSFVGGLLLLPSLGVAVPRGSAVLFGALALATAPATTVLVFKENRSEGPNPFVRNEP